MTIIEANKELERIDNQLDLLLTKRQIIIESTIYPKSGTGERVNGGKKEDKYKHLDYAIDTIDPEIELLYKEKKVYEEFIEKELHRLGKYNEVEQLIIFYKEQTTENYTWEQISQRVHYSVTQCRRIYRKWKKQRSIE
jgi:hypothetical protein